MRRRRSTSEATRVALARFAPVLLGAAIGVVAAVVVAPPSAPPEFFLVTAQVLPIVLLALALEARVFGTGPRRFPPAEKTARLIDAARLCTQVLLVISFIAAEWKAIDALTVRGSPLNDPALEYFTLAWGFVTVGAVALIGTGRPRVKARLSGWVQGRFVVVELGMSNEYGERDVQPTMTFLVPAEHEIEACDQHGNPEPHSMLRVRTTPEVIDGEGPWWYVAERVALAAEESVVKYFAVAHRGERTLPVVLRLDDVELPGGRVQATHRVVVGDS